MTRVGVRVRVGLPLEPGEPASWGDAYAPCLFLRRNFERKKIVFFSRKKLKMEEIAKNVIRKGVKYSCVENTYNLDLHTKTLHRKFPKNQPRNQSDCLRKNMFLIEQNRDLWQANKKLSGAIFYLSSFCDRFGFPAWILSQKVFYTIEKHKNSDGFPSFWTEMGKCILH